MIAAYYNQLAPYYPYIFADWETSIQHQGGVLDELIREYFPSGVKTILDAACGIGTQSLGLAQRGYSLTASDISTVEVERADIEAQKRGLSISFGVADMRQLRSIYRHPFDLVIACDNAIPHLLSDADILQAFQQFYQCTLEHGGCLVSVRDYATLKHDNCHFYPRTVHETPSGKLILFDIWQFEGDYYDMTTYVIEDKGQSKANTHVIQGGRYYCVSIARLEELLLQAGFQRVITLRERYFQPLLIGLKI